MASASIQSYRIAARRASLLTKHAAKKRNKAEAEAKSAFLHAAVAAHVSSWDAYVKQIAEEYFNKAANPKDPRYSAFHALLLAEMRAKRDKLNTPNSDNTRVFLMNTTGFDPWPVWTGITAFGGNLTSTLFVRNRLDEIFKVRHSFSHGFSMPGYAWNTDAHGGVRLTCQILIEVERFFTQLVLRTDIGLASHMSKQHGVPAPW